MRNPLVHGRLADAGIPVIVYTTFKAGMATEEAP